MVLAIQPTANVTVALNSSDTTEGTVSPASLTFTPGNWNQPQVATITGVDDTIADGSFSYTVITEPATSTDTRFEGYNVADVQVLNYDNDFASQRAIQPLGSLIYNSTLEGVIAAPGRTESYSLLLDPGQTLTVLVESSETLRATIQVYGPGNKLAGSATAASSGTTRWSRPVRIPGQIAGNGSAPATYRIVVGGADGTTGSFTVATYLNAALETELHNGPANDAMASAQNLEDSFISLHNANNNGNSPLPQRGAVLGEITVLVPDPADWYRFDLKSGQSATVALSMLGGNDAQVTLVGPNGTTLALGSSDQADNVDQIISNFVATSTGTYYLSVTSAGGATYNLVVTRNADFDTENNDSIETAQPIFSPEAAGRRWVMGAVEAEARLFAASWSTPFVILELDPESGEVINQIPAPESISGSDGLAYNGSSLFFVNGYGNQLLWELNPDTGAVIDSDALPFVYYYDGLAALGGSIYVANFATDQILQFDPVTDTIVNTLYVPTDIGGGLAGISGPDSLIATVGAYSVVELDPATGAIRQSFSPPAGPIYGTGVIDGEIYLGNAFGGGVSVWSRDGVFQRYVSAPFGISASGADDVGGVPKGDFYKITAEGNKTIEIETSTPAGLAGEFQNGLDSTIRLYDAAGKFLSTNDNGRLTVAMRSCRTRCRKTLVGLSISRWRPLTKLRS